MLPFLAFANSKPLIGWKRILPASKNTSWGIITNHIASLATLGLMLQLSLIYFFTAISKMGQEIWQNGTALYYILRINDFRASDLNISLTRWGPFVVFVTYLTLAWEFSFPFLIWSRKTRTVIVLVSLLMHFGIFVLMRIDNFSFIMVSFYPLLFTDDELRKGYERFKQILRLDHRPKQGSSSIVMQTERNRP